MDAHEHSLQVTWPVILNSVSGHSLLLLWGDMLSFCCVLGFCEFSIEVSWELAFAQGLWGNSICFVAVCFVKTEEKTKP